MAQSSKESPCNGGDCLQYRRPWFDSWVERSPGGGTVTLSIILAWEIPWTEEPSGPSSMGSQESNVIMTKPFHPHHQCSYILIVFQIYTLLSLSLFKNSVPHHFFPSLKHHQNSALCFHIPCSNCVQSRSSIYNFQCVFIGNGITGAVVIDYLQMNLNPSFSASLTNLQTCNVIVTAKLFHSQTYQAFPYILAFIFGQW